jgi:hypothetical protein
MFCQFLEIPGQQPGAGTPIASRPDMDRAVDRWRNNSQPQWLGGIEKAAFKCSGWSQKDARVLGDSLG